MSLLIKGMEMPESCYGCQLSKPFYHISFCAIAGRNNTPLGDKKTWCPLIKFPTPHGRLIDADAFLATVRPYSASDEHQACTLLTVKRLIVEHIAAAPTIIEAEE